MFNLYLYRARKFKWGMAKINKEWDKNIEHIDINNIKEC